MHFGTDNYAWRLLGKLRKYSVSLQGDAQRKNITPSQTGCVSVGSSCPDNAVTRRIPRRLLSRDKVGQAGPFVTNRHQQGRVVGLDHQDKYVFSRRVRIGMFGSVQ